MQVLEISLLVDLVVQVLLRSFNAAIALKNVVCHGRLANSTFHVLSTGALGLGERDLFTIVLWVLINTIFISLLPRRNFARERDQHLEFDLRPHLFLLVWLAKAYLVDIEMAESRSAAVILDELDLSRTRQV